MRSNVMLLLISTFVSLQFSWHFLVFRMNGDLQIINYSIWLQRGFKPRKELYANMKTTLCRKQQKRSNRINNHRNKQYYPVIYLRCVICRNVGKIEINNVALLL